MDAYDAMKSLHKEIRKKVAKKYAKVIRYRDLKKNLAEELRISSVAMIPHK